MVMFGKKKKIIIVGFPHCGTSILKSIIGHIEEVHEIYEETDKVPEIIEKEQKDKTILIKFPFAHPKFFTKEYEEYIKIFIIRNPLWIFSSLNKRFSNKIPANHSIEEYKKTCERYEELRKKSIKDVFYIRYEDIFEDKFKELKKILEEIRLDYTEEIFKNENYSNTIIESYMNKIPKKIPKCTNHGEYRTYQINQEFVNNNDRNKLCLSDKQVKTIRSSEAIKKIYSEEELRIT